MRPGPVPPSVPSARHKHNNLTFLAIQDENMSPFLKTRTWTLWPLVSKSMVDISFLVNISISAPIVM